MTLHKLWWLACVSLALGGGFLLADDVPLILNNSGPVVLDMPIWFSAELTDYEEGEVLNWQWSDDLSHGASQYINGEKAYWSITYDSEAFSWYTGKRTVQLIIKKRYGVVWLTRNKASTSYDLTESLNGELTVLQPNVTLAVSGTKYISTANETNITAVIHDPHDWLKQHTEMSNFYWIINDGLHALCSTPSLIINITKPGNYTIQANIIVDISNEIITTTTTTTTTSTTTTTTTTTPKSDNHTTTSPPPTTTSIATTTPNGTTTTPTPPSPNNRTWRCDGYWPQAGHSGGLVEARNLKLGYFHKKIVAKQPIEQLNATGKTWLKHGELFNLTIQCSGSGPWGYCHKVYSGVYNVTGNETCDMEDITMTNDCNFMAIHYFRETGTHTYLLIINNDISLVIQPIAVIIYNVDRKPQLSYIIIPVSCSLVVIIIIVFGIAYFIQSRHRYSVEVADFDFGASEDPEYKTLYEQLKESLSHAISGQDVEGDEETKWRGRAHIVERPRILEEED
ncbi:uncharacterized protein [Procambarus clarkii]|uniref:uncharacterized protein isoform X2 n=1 Tax=Procambarus clarkii TaxID=6728 RepID=UPI001E67197A|nr:uncharacterized protein LOC123754248 isoform X2 [Procambarus clarkii]